MKVKELIAKLSLVDPELDVVVEPNLEVNPNDLQPVTFYMHETDHYDEGSDEEVTVKVLALSSPSWKYGITEEEEAEEFKVKK